MSDEKENQGLNEPLLNIKKIAQDEDSTLIDLGGANRGIQVKKRDIDI